MKLLRGLKSLAVLKQGAAITLGNFDGVHLGHQALLQQLCKRAHERRLLSVVIFFEPQPSEFFNQQAPARLMSRQQKLKYLHCLGSVDNCSKITALPTSRDLIARSMDPAVKPREVSSGANCQQTLESRGHGLTAISSLRFSGLTVEPMDPAVTREVGLEGIDYVYCIKFDHHFSELSRETFAKDYLLKLFHAKYILVGKDFRFGQHRTGTPEYLTEIAATMHCEVETFQDFVDNKQRVSSTQIREALTLGHLQEAAKLLGRPYSLSGRVVKGDARARLWGFPTANVWLKDQKLPLKGVFLVKVQAQQIYWGVANIGTRPTFSGVQPRLEVHLFDFAGTLYNKHIEVFFIAQLREEQKFSSAEALVAQIHLDCAEARAMMVKVDKA